MFIIKFIIKVVAAFFIVIVIMTIFILIGLPEPSPEAVQESVDNLYSQVAEDTVKQYDQVKIHGTMIERCVRAGLVAEGYLQAQDNANFAKWKGIEEIDCSKAGMPR